MNTETIAVIRGSTDKMGNRTKAGNGTVQGIFAWGQGTGTGKYSTGQGFKGENNGMTAQLYVERGTDLKDKDRIRRANGDEFRVVGGASWDQDFPFDGFDFGWMVFQVESM